MKILLVSDEYPPYVFGGVAFYVQSIAREMVKRGIEVTVVAGGSGLDRCTVAYENGVRVVRLPVPNIPPRHVWFQIFNRERIVELAKSADLVHVQACCASLALGRMKKQNGTPIVLTSHGSYKEVLRAYALFGGPSSVRGGGDLFHAPPSLVFHAYLQAVDVRYADRIIAVSHHLKNELVRDYSLRHSSKPIAVIPPAVEPPARFGRAEHESLGETRKSPIKIVFVGRLFWVKGVHLLVRAMKAIVHDRNMKNISLDIVGSGPLDGFLRSLIAENNLDKFVKFVGFVDREEVFRMVRAADMFALPSFYEANPIALLEAVWLGTPCLVFNLPWSQEFIRTLPNVTAVREVNPSSMADAILHMEQSKHGGAKGTSVYESHEGVGREYNSSFIFQRLLALYEDVIDSR